MAKKKHHSKHIHVDHHPDGSHTVKHVMDDGSEHASAHGNLDSVHDHIQDSIGQPNPGEMEADGGQHGVPAEQAGPAGLPMGGPANG